MPFDYVSEVPIETIAASVRRSQLSLAGDRLLKSSAALAAFLSLGPEIIKELWILVELVEIKNHRTPLVGSLYGHLAANHR